MKGRQEPIYLLISLIHFFFYNSTNKRAREMNREREIRIWARAQSLPLSAAYEIETQ